MVERRGSAITVAVETATVLAGLVVRLRAYDTDDTAEAGHSDLG